MSPHLIVMAGFGNVGQAVARLIAEGHPAAEGVAIAGVSDPRFGTVAEKGPVDAAALLQAAAGGSFEGVEGHLGDVGVSGMLEAAGAQTLVELTFTDLATGEPATTHIRQALGSGMSVSTTNKGPIALHYEELSELAEINGCVLSFEGTVMSGTPAVELAMTVKHAGCNGVTGILNGTTNFMITRMEEGISYDHALAEAQERGYAEADPSGDVDGHDTAAKLAILARVLGEVSIAVQDIERVPLSTLSAEDVEMAGSAGERWRYVGLLERRDDVWRAGVAPRRLAATDPLATVGGSTNALTFRTELLGDVTITGPGAGRKETAFAVIADLRHIDKVITT